ncbi:MAG: hypothetical protein IJG17_06305 [Eubacterium sp.]|nr:hypothetical protein [Eubacterium sp.]
MKISEVYPEYVFQRLGKYRVVAVDFNKGEFIELVNRTAGQVQRLVEQAAQGGVKFYQIEEA